jgi:soluble lytic murein transglycosylase-like protein
VHGIYRGKGKGLRRFWRRFFSGKNTTSIPSLVEKASLKYGIPKEILMAIISVESGFNPRAYNKNKDGTKDRGVTHVNFTSVA